MDKLIKDIINNWADYPNFLLNKRSFYRIFWIKTKKKRRKICNPAEGLKQIQRQIVNVLNMIELPVWVNGFVKNKSIQTNAEIHCNKRMIIAFDVKDFFESTSEKILRKELGRYFDNESVNLLINIAMLDDGLPQGAPTSPPMANIAFLSTDIRLKELADKNCGVYSRYADDITISSTDRGIGDLVRYVGLLVEDGGYLIKDVKTRALPASNRQTVTGLVVNQKVQPPARYRYNFKAKVYNIAREIKTKGIVVGRGKKAEIKGEYVWIKRFNKHFAEKYLQENVSIIMSS